MRVYALTQKGIMKTENEDRIIINQSILSSGFYVDEVQSGFVAIADGVGGNNAGAVASHFLAYRLGTMDGIDDLLSINQELIEYSTTQERLKNMATTLALITVESETPEIVYVGNTRVYSIMNNRYLKQITQDDTTVEYMRAIHDVDETWIELSNRKNEITACFGAGDASLCKLKRIKIDQHNSGFVITSDGVHDYVGIDDLEELLCSDKDIHTRLQEVVACALNNGSKDDISILFAQ